MVSVYSCHVVTGTVSYSVRCTWRYSVPAWYCTPGAAHAGAGGAQDFFFRLPNAHTPSAQHSSANAARPRTSLFICFPRIKEERMGKLGTLGYLWKECSD